MYQIYLKNYNKNMTYLKIKLTCIIVIQPIIIHKSMNKILKV